MFKWFQAPTFPNDEDKTRSALLLNIVLNTFIATLPIIIFGVFLGNNIERREIVVPIISISWLAIIGLRVVMLKGWVVIAGILTTLIIFTTTTLTVYNLGTIRAPATSFYLLGIVLSGLVIGRRAIAWSAGLSAITIIIFLVAENEGLLPAPNLTVSVTQAITFVVSYSIISVLLYLAVQSIDQALSRARNEVEIRKQAEDALQQTNSRLEILHEIDRALLSAHSLHDIAKSALVRIRKLIPSERASATLFNFQTNEAAFLAADFDGMESIPDTPVDMEEYGWNVIEQLQQNKPWFTEDVLTESKLTDLNKRLVDNHGIRVWLSLPLLYQGELIGALNLGRTAGKPFQQEDAIIAHDIANQLAIALQQTNLYNKLQKELSERQKLIAELEEKNDELTRFTYTVSHDLRNPLVTIKGFLGMLSKDLQENKPEKVQNDFDRIANATDKMDALLSDLLQLSRIGRIINPPKEIDTARLIQNALDSVDARIRSRSANVKIEADLPDLYGDRTRLREVFENLIDNAIKYMGEQSDPVIKIGIRDQVDMPVFFVKDNGIGIDQQYHEKIFGLFEKLNPNIEGTGIGLALVKRIIETHGGKIWVESEGPGKGSTFCFTVPQQPV